MPLWACVGWSSSDLKLWVDKPQVSNICYNCKALNMYAEYPELVSSQGKIRTLSRVTFSATCHVKGVLWWPYELSNKYITSAHHIKNLQYLLIAILPQQRASHTACLYKEGVQYYTIIYNIGLQKKLYTFFKDSLFSENTHITPHPTTYLMIALQSQNQTCNTSRELHKEHDTQTIQKQCFLRSQSSKDTN